MVQTPFRIIRLCNARHHLIVIQYVRGPFTDWFSPQSFTENYRRYVSFISSPFSFLSSSKYCGTSLFSVVPQLFWADWRGAAIWSIQAATELSLQLVVSTQRPLIKSAGFTVILSCDVYHPVRSCWAGLVTCLCGINIGNIPGKARRPYRFGFSLYLQPSHWTSPV